MYQTLTVQPLGPAIGAEVQNLDLKNDFSETILNELEAVLIKHEAILLHVPDLTPEQHLVLAQYFGQPEVPPAFADL